VQVVDQYLVVLLAVVLLVVVVLPFAALQDLALFLGLLPVLVWLDDP
jgi:hypothetical protein